MATTEPDAVEEARDRVLDRAQGWVSKPTLIEWWQFQEGVYGLIAAAEQRGRVNADSGTCGYGRDLCDRQFGHAGAHVAAQGGQRMTTPTRAKLVEAVKETRKPLDEYEYVHFDAALDAYGAACRALGEYDARVKTASDQADAIHAAYLLGVEKGKAVGREEAEAPAP